MLEEKKKFELKDIFVKALDGLTGAKYEPVELLTSQVVNGVNYKFLADGTKTTNPITIGEACPETIRRYIEKQS